MGSRPQAVGNAICAAYTTWGRSQSRGRYFNAYAGKNGAIYGTTSSAGSTASDSACPAVYPFIAGCGIVFELTPPSTPGGAWTETVLHSFSGQDGDGAIPLGSLTLSSSGEFYGNTSAGGTAGKGTIFSPVP